MTVTGYQDFGRTVQTNVLPLITVNLVVGGSYVAPNVVYLGDLGFIDVFAITNGLNDHYSIGLRWWDDANKMVYAGQDNFVTGPGMEAGLQYKCRGRYLSVIVANNDATDVQPVTVYFRGTNAQAKFYVGNNQATPIAWVDQTVNAASSVSVNATTIAPGPAILACQHNSNNSWAVELQFWNVATKSWQRFVHWDAAAAGQSYITPVILPAAPIRMVVINNEASTNRTMFASLTA